MLSKEPMSKESWLDRPLLTAVKLDREKALYALFITLAVLSRLWDLGVRVMSHDETVHIQWSWYLFQGRGYSHTPLSHGPFLFHSTALSYYLFGDSDFSARLVVALMGIVLVALPYVFRRWLGRTGALATSFLFLISPSLLYYSRYIRHDIPIIVWSLIALLAILRYLAVQMSDGTESEEEQADHSTNVTLSAAGHSIDPSTDSLARDWSENRDAKLIDRRTRWLLILAGALSLMYATKEVAFIYVAIYGSFLVFLFIARLGTPRWQGPNWERWSRVLLLIAAGALLLSALTFGLSGLVDSPTTGAFDEALESETTASGATTTAADFLSWIANVGVLAAVIAILGYGGLLAFASPSHQRLILTVVGLVTVVVVAMALFLFSLNLVELFPIQHVDCGQAPVPGAVPGEMSCSQSDCKLIQGLCQRPVPVVASDSAIEFDETGTRIAVQLTRLEIMIVVVLIGMFTMMAGTAVYWLLRRLKPFRRGEWPAMDLIVFIGSFTLPSLSPIAINGLSRFLSNLFFGVNAAFNALDYSEAGLLRSAGIVFILLAVSVAVGLWWDLRRWLLSATVFYVIFIVLFTTVFTNGNGLASGTVGSLGYWLEQQEVQRGSQPWYYYGLLVPLYEYLPLIGFVAAVIYLLVRGLRPKAAPAAEAPNESTVELDTSPTATEGVREPISLKTAFVLFLIYWNAMTWLAYSAAGEKMPWLTTHFAVPLALTTGWIVGKLVEGVDWRTVLRRGGWIIILIAPVGLAALVQTLSPWLTAPAASRPFSGYGIGQLNTTMQFVSALLVLSAIVGILVWVWRRIGPSAIGRLLAMVALAVLAVATMRTAWIFSFINFDYASEFLVYAHATPDVREVMQQIEDISRRTSGELSLNIAYTADGSYPFIWYLRNYPNAVQLPNPPSRPDLEKPVIIAGDKEWAGIEPYLGDTYICNHHNFLWWPMQDYYNLNWDRIRYAVTNPEMRAALWDIVFRRDFRKYEQATDKTVRLSEWPLRDSFRFCIRRDVMAQVWSESAGPVTLAPSIEEVASDLPDYADLQRPIAAELVVSALGPRGNFNAPHDMALDADGFLYVADSNNHRIVKFSPEGEVVDTWDSTWWQGVQWKPGCLDANDQPLALADGEFCEPWGITVGPDNKVYVADTWNHRIQVFTTAGEFLGQFGIFGQSGSSVSSAPSQFYGPRDIVVSEQGDIYVSDTGNKRVQIFNPDFSHRSSFGGPGIIEGRLEEPVGLTLGPDNLIYVADTWNNRIQVFTPEGVFQREWPIVAWESESIVNKPYLATDSAGRVYVSDPEGARVLVFDAVGTPLAVLGGLGSSLFQLPTGVVLDSQDHLWISDATNQRLLRFPSLTFDQEGNQP
jgi:uncharacterized protein (TIGR03663 family)